MILGGMRNFVWRFASFNAPYVGFMFVLFGNWGETWIGSCLRGWDCFRGDCFSPIWQGLASMPLGLEGGDVRSATLPITSTLGGRCT